MGLLPDGLAARYQRLEPWGMGLLMLLVFLPFLTDGAVGLGVVMNPAVRFFEGLLLGSPGGFG